MKRRLVVRKLRKDSWMKVYKGWRFTGLKDVEGISGLKGLVTFWDILTSISGSWNFSRSTFWSHLNRGMEAEIGGIARQAEERLNELHPDQRPEPKPGSCRKWGMYWGIDVPTCANRFKMIQRSRIGTCYELLWSMKSCTNFVLFFFCIRLFHGLAM